MAVSDRGHASEQAIEYHYDIGTDFYRLWLDDTLTYSAALWDPELLAEGAAGLQRAQLRKLDYAAEQAGARRARSVLDVGCGWGSMLRRLVEVHEVEHAVGLTLSRAQVRYIREQAWPRATVALESYLDHRPSEPYGALACTGAFEHFARPEMDSDQRLRVYRSFFEWCHSALAAGGGMYLQTIAYGASEREQGLTFLQREIFPESDLPQLSEICRATEGLFEVVIVRNDRRDYEHTVKVWDRRLQQARARAAELVSDATVERYRKYLRLAAIGFHTGSLVLYRISLRRIG